MTITRLGDMIAQLTDPNISRHRRDDIIRQLNELGDREEKYKSWTQLTDQRINSDAVDFPITLLYNKVLEADKTSIVFDVPSNIRNVIIMGSGSITSANGGNIWAQFNDDTGNNYAWQAIKGDNVTLTGFQDLSDPYVALGVFGTTGAGAGVNGSFRAEIIHAKGPWKKNVLSHVYTAEFNDLYLLGSTWADTDPIVKVEVFGTDNTLVKGSTNLALGSLFTVYGIK